ncbi:MAG: hypothetical protein LQ338_007885 [Usnochroma carphineum]|nr:MAG: hypothetical protein LQ338_007885 [Usnochroma carphineum]
MFPFMRTASLLSTLLFASTAWADCECGYTVNGTLYTDLVESDFLHMKDINESGWVPQSYTVDPTMARGPFGKDASPKQIAFNPLKSRYDWAGDGINGGDAGAQIFVRGGDPGQGGLIPMGEMDTNRTDMLYGSFRAGVKLTGIPGTCGAFFWYLNDSQEIDMEFLSSQFNATSHPVNLVLQSEAAVAAGYDAGNTKAFQVHQLPFNPSDGFHEYRFDWFKDHVDFYADGVLLRTMSGDGVPADPGHLTLSQWSNGDPKWSGGPPAEDAVMTVNYVKAYFNSSDTKRQGDWKNRCRDINTPKATCEVPEITAPPQGNVSAKTFFFSQQHNMTVNQTIPGNNPNTETESGAWSIRPSTQAISTALILVSFVPFMEWWS